MSLCRFYSAGKGAGREATRLAEIQVQQAVTKEQEREAKAILEKKKKGEKGKSDGGSSLSSLSFSLIDVLLPT